MTQIFAHRGSKSNRPENTLAAFAQAIRVGSDGLELDVHRTKDHKLVVIHDERVDRTTNGRGLVRQLSLKEIKELDAGSWFHPSYFREKIPTLEEVLDFLEAQGFNGILNIELKTNRYPYFKIEKEVASLMGAKERPFSHLYSSFNIFSLFLMKKYDPHAELACLMKRHPFYFWLVEHLPFVGTLHLGHSSFQDLDKRRQKPLRLWTVNQTREMKASFLAGVEGIITDRPEEAVKIREAIYRKKPH